jgi:DNA-binding response OmpR family regulator
MLTALSEQSMVVQSAKLGIKDYIRKPFHPQSFADRIKKILSEG